MLFATANAVADGVSFPPKPPRSDYFVDRANLILDTERIEINASASGLLHDEQVALYVVTIESLATYGAGQFSIENYAARLFDHWGIGFDDRNYGVLLLVSRGDRKARIELGADWAHDYDAEARQVMDDLIIPHFKRDEYSLGIAQGVRGLDSMARGLALPKRIRPWWVIPLFLAGVVLVIAVIVSLFKNGKAGWGWALLALLGAFLLIVITQIWRSSGSGDGFGGGMSGGGGASGSW